MPVTLVSTGVQFPDSTTQTTAAVIPALTANSGYYLTNNGTTTQWRPITAVTGTNLYLQANFGGF